MMTMSVTDQAWVLNPGAIKAQLLDDLIRFSVSKTGVGVKIPARGETEFLQICG